MRPLLDYAARLDEDINRWMDQNYVNINQGALDMITKMKVAIMSKIAIADKIALKLDLDINDNICKNLKYPSDTKIVDRPSEAKYFSRELEDDTTFVWAGFVKPGRHSFLVRDPISLKG